MARTYSAPYICCSAANSSAAKKSARPLSCASSYSAELLFHLGSAFVAECSHIARRDRGEVTQPVAVDHHPAAWFALECRLEMGRSDDPRVLFARSPCLATSSSEAKVRYVWRACAPLRHDRSDVRGPNSGWFRWHQSLAADHDTIKEAVVLRRGWERTEGSLLFHQPRDGASPVASAGRSVFTWLNHCCIARPDPVVMKGATWEEVAFHKFDEIFDHCLSGSRRWSAGLGKKFELRSQLLVGRIPDRLMLGVSPQHRCFHIVRHHHPGHATNGLETANQARKSVSSRISV